MKHSRFLYLGLIFAICFGFGTVVSAQTEETVAEPTLYEEEVVVNDDIGSEGIEGTEVEDATEGSEDIVIEEINKVPSTFGLWWRGIKESIIVGLEFDPIQKAEKQLQHAKERMRIAELMSESENENIQERAQNMIEKAQKFMVRVEEKSEKWTDKSDDKVNRLREHLADFQLRREQVMDKIEESIPEDKKERIQELREKGLEQGARLIKAIDNGNIPAPVREHLQNVKERIDEHTEEIKLFRDEKHDLLQKAKDGDEDAKESLEQLNEERKEGMKERVNTLREKAGEMGNIIREQSKGVVQKLKEMDGREDVQDKIEDLRNIREDKQDGLEGVELKPKPIPIPIEVIKHREKELMGELRREPPESREDSVSDTDSNTEEQD